VPAVRPSSRLPRLDRPHPGVPGGPAPDPARAPSLVLQQTHASAYRRPQTGHLSDPALGWAPLLEPGLTLLNGERRTLRAFTHEVAHHALLHHDGHVLWCDAAHAFDPYWFAELNLENGLEADHGATRLLIKRCMTPFQWDSVLTQHLEDKLLHVDASLIIAAPYDALFSTDELTDWEQEDYVRFSLRHLRSLARRHRIPLLLAVDMDRWWRTHPDLARMAYEAVHGRWTITAPGGRLRAVRQGSGTAVDPYIRRQVTLLDFIAPRHTGLEEDAAHGQAQEA